MTGGATRDSTFFVPAQTTILAGYPLTANPPDADRNPLQFPVTLSADLDRNDGDYDQFMPAGPYTTMASNAYHCIVVADTATSQNTILSGLTVVAGNADGGFAKGNGGGIYCGAGAPSILNCRIEHCRAVLANPPPDVEAFLENPNDGAGGGVFALTSGILVIRDTTFYQNRAWWGGGLFVGPPDAAPTTGGVLLDGCHFLENLVAPDVLPTGHIRGGGANLGHGLGKIDIVNCDFKSNISDDSQGGGAGGAALQMGLTEFGYGCGASCGTQQVECGEDCIPGSCSSMACASCCTNTRITNTLFAGNLSRGLIGGAIRMNRKSVFTNCTIVANHTDWSFGGGVIVGHGGFVEFNNCIVRHNSVGPGVTYTLFEHQIHNSTGCLWIRNCNIEGWGGPTGETCIDPASANNIDQDAQFVTAEDGVDNTWGTADDVLTDLSLQSASLCIDTGGNGLLPPDDIGDIDDDLTIIGQQLPLDLRYDDRRRDGTCGGSALDVDMGAYEYLCIGDLDGNCIVNGNDLALLLGEWLDEFYFPCPQFDPYDLNRDCKITGPDLALLLGSWGACPTGGEGAFTGGGGESASSGEAGCGDDYELFMQWLEAGDWESFQLWYECVLESSGGEATQ